MKKSLKIILFTLSCVFIIVCGVLLSISLTLKSYALDESKLINLESTVTFLDVDGNKFSEQSNGVEVTELKNIPTHTQKAFIAVEDKRFYKHSGIDYKGMFRAIVNNVKSFSLKEGASTISQQLIKNTHLSNEKTLKRKLAEIKLTTKLEREFSKDEILEKYLNTIYFGDNCYGITSASRHYFDKKPDELNINESAILAGIIKAPSYYSPTLNPEKCFERKNLVLKLMHEQGYINKDEYNFSKVQAIETKTVDKNNDYTFSYLAKKELNELTEKFPYQNHEIIVKTTLEPYIDEIVREKIKNYNEIDCNKSIVVINKNGEIVSYFSTCGDVYRQMGSIIKPLAVYAPAIEKNVVNSYTFLSDEKTDFSGYSPSNYNDKYYGDISVKDSLAFSSNVCAVKILNYLGVNNSINYLDKLGVKTTKSDKSLALALGATENGAKLTQIANAYNVFLNKGILAKTSTIKSIVKNNINFPMNYSKNKQKVFEPDSVDVMNDMLKNVVLNGTAKKLSFLGFEVCAKTGTVGNKNGNSDAYCISYNGEYVIGVWFGANDNSLLDNFITGGGYPAILSSEIWGGIYNNKQPPKPIDCSKNAIETLIDKDCYEKEKEVILSNESDYNRATIKAIFTKKAYESIVSNSRKIPFIKNYNLSVKYNEVCIELCLTQNSNALIYKLNGNGKTLLYDTYNKDSTFIDKNVYPNNSYQYLIIPYYKVDNKIVFGKEMLTRKIKTPSKVLGDKWWIDDFN